LPKAWAQNTDVILLTILFITYILNVKGDNFYVTAFL
jgi:hypothetical protein